MHNYDRRYIRLAIKDIGVSTLTEKLGEHGLGISEPISNFCLERNDQGDYLKHKPSGSLIVKLKVSPKYGWEHD